MLSFDTVHTLTGQLLAGTQADDPATVTGHRTGRPRYDLLVLHHGPATDPPTAIRRMSCHSIPISHHVVAAYRGGLSDLLPDLATALRTVPSGHSRTPRIAARAVAALRGVIAAPDPGLQLLAIAVAYDDIDTSPVPGPVPGPATSQAAPRSADDIRRRYDVTAVRRVDAVDVDGRVYHVVQQPGQPASVLIDDEPDPADIPATLPGLTDLLTAAREHPMSARADTGPRAAEPDGTPDSG